MGKKIYVLGTRYDVEFVAEPDIEMVRYNPNCFGYCDCNSHLIKVVKNADDHVTHKTLVHEVVHAFFFESGFPNHEERLVEWFETQFDKINEVINHVESDKNLPVKN